MTIREKLIQILKVPIYPHEQADPAEVVADYLLDNGVTVQRWIPVSERLPSDRGDVLVCAWCHEKWKTLLGWYAITSDMWHILTADGFLPCEHVTHWMPLPEPHERR